MLEATLQLDKVQSAHEGEWVALDPLSKEVWGSAKTLERLMDELSEKERQEGPILFKVPPGDVSLSPTGYEI